jgi:ubiquitin-like modifier-activating enzyme ATG7
VDNGVVSFSNPARQSLYTFEDCLSGSTLKVDAAAAAMAKIDPGVVTPWALFTCN